MLLALDVGNTNVVLGFYRGRGREAALVASWRLGTDRARTADEYGALVQGLLSSQGLKNADVAHVAISSVVPPVNRDLAEFSRRYFNAEPFFVSAEANLGMTIRYDSPSDVGADRICNAVGAFGKYGGPLVVVDYGTATTFDAIAENGDYLGGAIAPGISISMNALFITVGLIGIVIIYYMRRSRYVNEQLACATGKENEFFENLNGFLNGFKEFLIILNVFITNFEKLRGIKSKVEKVGGLIDNILFLL